MSVVAFLRVQPSVSSKKASDGWYIEIELVIAARNSMKNQSAPMKLPIGPMWAKTMGSVLKPRPNVPPATAAVVPATPEEDEGRGQRDHAAEADLEQLVGGGGGEAGQHHVVLLLHVGRVVDDHAEADGEAEEDLPRGGEPRLRVRERREVRVPHVAEPVDHVLIGLGRRRACRG